jgi:hypothetical protein
MGNTLKGRFKPQHPEKYKGDPSNIIYRSSWEKDVMGWCDETTQVLWWKSEEVFIPYPNPIRKRWCRYYPDIIMGIKRDYGEEVRVVEIKPHKQTQPPPTPKRKTKSYYYQLEQYVINQSKWKETRKYCENRGWNFQILTEENNPKWKKYKPKNNK